MIQGAKGGAAAPKPRYQGVRTGRCAARGFTLIELMITVAVVAILAAIAIPSYQDQVRKSRRGQAKADLVELAQVLERRHSVNHHYGGALPFSQSPRETGAPARYNLTIDPATGTPQAFVLTAEPVDGQAEDRCGTLTLSNTGEKTKTGSAPLSDCW